MRLCRVGVRNLPRIAAGPIIETAHADAIAASPLVRRTATRPGTQSDSTATSRCRQQILAVLSIVVVDAPIRGRGAVRHTDPP